MNVFLKRNGNDGLRRRKRLKFPSTIFLVSFLEESNIMPSCHWQWHACSKSPHCGTLLDLRPVRLWLADARLAIATELSLAARLPLNSRWNPSSFAYHGALYDCLGIIQMIKGSWIVLELARASWWKEGSQKTAKESPSSHCGLTMINEFIAGA